MEQSEDQLYPIGYRIPKGDWSLRYCKAGAVGVDIPNRGAGNGNHQLEGTCIGNAVAGAYTLDIPETCVDFPAVSYTAKDAYKDGYVWIMGAAGDPGKHEFHRIKRNDKGNGSYVRLYLFEPIQNSQDTPWITAYPNIYSNVVMDYPNIPTGKMGIVSVPLIPVTANYHFWGLTWGPMWTTAYDATPGALDNDREVYFRLPGGTITLTREFDLTTVCFQRAGFILPNTEHTGDMCFMLQLAP